MELEDKLDMLKYISESQRNEFENRRKIEWRIVFSVISLFLLIVLYTLKDNILIDQNKSIVIILRIGFSIIGIISILFLKNVHLANIKNRMFAHKAEHAIQKILNNENPLPLNLFSSEENFYVFRNLYKHKVWAWFWQAALILFISIIAILIV